MQEFQMRYVVDADVWNIQTEVKKWDDRVFYDAREKRLHVAPGVCQCT
jgi:hypothetical protein